MKQHIYSLTVDQNAAVPSECPAQVTMIAMPVPEAALPLASVPSKYCPGNRLGAVSLTQPSVPPLVSTEMPDLTTALVKFGLQ